MVYEYQHLQQFNPGNTTVSVDQGTGHVYYAYISTELTPDELAEIHDLAHPPPFHTVPWFGVGVMPPGPAPDANAEAELRQVRKMLMRDFDALCPTQLPFKCRVPNTYVLPDLKLTFARTVVHAPAPPPAQIAGVFNENFAE